jgi:hypothetical protein
MISLEIIIRLGKILSGKSLIGDRHPLEHGEKTVRKN